jgi:hypothetical protein
VVRVGRIVKTKATKEPTLNPSGAGGQTRGRAAQLWASPNSVVPVRPWYSLSHPSPNTLTRLPLIHSQSPIERITDLLDNLPISACVELTRRLLYTASSLPTGDARPRAVLNTVILLLAEYGGAA